MVLGNTMGVTMLRSMGSGLGSSLERTMERATLPTVGITPASTLETMMVSPMACSLSGTMDLKLADSLLETMGAATD
jgi:hypothetical protein